MDRKQKKIVTALLIAGAVVGVGYALYRVNKSNPMGIFVYPAELLKWLGER